MIRRPPRSTLRTHSFPTRRSSDLPALAATLRRIAKKGRSAFYEGPVMEEIVKRLKELNGLHEPEDFAKQSSEYVEPVHAGYRGYDLYECPPHGQGITALVILRILAGFALATGK